MSVQLFHGDCLDVMQTLPPVDVVVTDPPYGVGKAEWDNEFPTFWIEPAWAITKKMLVMPGNSALIDAGKLIGKYKDEIVLHARNGMTRSKISFGNFIPVLACGEWKWEARPNHLPFNVSLTEKIEHPSPKPLPAMLKLIENYTSSGDTILDPFMGSGTTGVACVQLGRNFIGIEKNAEYFAIAKKRIEAAQLQIPMFTAPAPTVEQSPLWT